MKFKTTPAPEYQDPAHVGVLMLLSIIGLLSGMFWIATSEMEMEQLAFGVGMLIGAMYLWIASAIASNAAKGAWTSERLAYELQPVIDELRLQSDRREKSERDAEMAHAEEIRRVVQARLAAVDGNG